MPHRPWLRAAIGLLACIIGLHLSAIGARAQSADTILVNGKIVSGDAAAPVRGAIAIADGKILAISDSQNAAGVTNLTLARYLSQ